MAIDTADVEDEEAWLAEPPKRSRLRALLVVGLAAALVFYAGVQVQKRWGESGSTTAAAPTGFPGGGAGGGPPEGFPLPNAAATQDDAAADDDSTSVIGTLVTAENGVWVVEDLGGTRHEITVAEDVRVVRETQLSTDDVEDGATVDIDGTTDEQGHVTATTITVR